MSAGARGDRRKQLTGSRVGAGRRGAGVGAAACALAPGRHFLLGSWSPPTLTTAFGRGVCESQGLGGRRGQRGAVDAQIPLGLA